MKRKEFTTADGSLTISKDRFGYSVTDNDTGRTYAERNSMERADFNFRFRAVQDLIKF